MKLRLLSAFLLAALLLACGCDGGSGSSSENVINGTWTIDIEKTIASSEEIKNQLGSEPAAMDMLKAVLGDSSVNIDTAKGVLSGKMVGEEMPETKFTIISNSGNVVKIKEEGGEEIDITIVDANTISLNDDSGMKLILVRK